jgi:hypothetical protein
MPTLIQIHYHNRIGGVTKVMQTYTDAFLSGRNAQARKSITICHVNESQENLPGHSQVNIPECDYEEYTNRKQINVKSRALAAILKKILTNKDLPLPIMLVGHNIALGKNIALSKAFSELCLTYASGSIRFFSVIHDLPYEGRMPLLKNICELSAKGIKVGEWLLPSDKPLRYLVINKTHAHILKKAHVPYTFLPNLVTSPKQETSQFFSRMKLLDALAKLAVTDGTRLKKSAPFFFYPCRCINRKNIIEAILMFCIAQPGNLILGTRGVSTRDRAFLKSIRQLCKKFSLPVICDVNRIGAFNDMFHFSTACVSTSVREGFGYSLYEPWLAHKAVAGRRPLGFDGLGSIKMPYLYDSIKVPVKLVPHNFGDVSVLFKQYLNVLSNENSIQIASKSTGFDISQNSLQNTVDLGFLDTELQIKVVEKLLMNHDDYLLWHKLNRNEIANVQRVTRSSEAVMRCIAYNRKKIEMNLGLGAFRKRLVRCLGQKTTKMMHKQDLERVFARKYKELVTFPII